MVKRAVQNTVTAEIGAIYADYVMNYEQEAGLYNLLEDQIQKQSDEELRSRKNFIGHVTAAAFIVDKPSRRVLLLEHKALKKLLQPGGHVEQGDATPLAAAIRELEEETGLMASELVYRQAVPGNTLVPFDIDTHFIPENPKKQEPGHYHHDFRYLFMNEGDVEIMLDEQESTGFGWVEWDDFAKENHFKKVARKIEELAFRKSSSHFYDTVFTSFGEDVPSDIGCVAVQHILPSTYKFILYLNNIFKGRVTILAKPKSIDHSIKTKLEAMGVVIHVADRDVQYLKSVIKNTEGKRKLLLDIGGYFAGLTFEKSAGILGIVEDTENGHRRYESRKESEGQYPVLSVARSRLKENEDALVGQSVVHAADTILRNQNKLIEYMSCAVIGYGKVGAGVAAELQKKHIHPTVVERNPVRAIEAMRSGHYLMSLSNAVQNSKVIFCATGESSLTSADFRNVRDGAYLVSVTSSEDEFDLTFIDSEYEKKQVTDYVTKYSNEHNYFYLINNGNAVNFLYNAALDKFIYLVQAEILAAVAAVLSGRATKNKMTAVDLTKNSEAIAVEWLREFTN